MPTPLKLIELIVLLLILKVPVVELAAIPVIAVGDVVVVARDKLLPVIVAAVEEVVNPVTVGLAEPIVIVFPLKFPVFVKLEVIPILVPV